MRRLALALVLMLAACGPDIYQDAKPGTFEGRIFLMWIDEGGPMGDGKFVFVPVPGRELTFKRKDPDAKLKTIVPEMMYTDGGSIPRIAQVFKGFSPWGYAPAYMVHDWLFVANNCNTDGMGQGNELDVAGMTFQESADVMAEAIRTLVAQKMVKPSDVSEHLIPSVVGGSISRGLWDQKDACEDRRVRPEDRLAAEAGLPGSKRSLRGQLRTLKDGTQVPIKPGRVVSVFEY